MERLEYPDGVYDFKDLVTGGFYFVDKTMMVRDVCRAPGMVLLYTRPRRFGKSVNLSMLDYFFNMEHKDEPNLFEGLSISRCDECQEHRNAYPVIRMNFGKLKTGSEEKLDGSLENVVSEAADRILRSYDSNVFKKHDIGFLERCRDGCLDNIRIDDSISKICRILEWTFGKKSIILVDEYDHCVQNVSSENEYKAIVDRMRPFMEQTFKFNDSLRTGVVTGIMPLVKAGMLSSFNNPVVCDIISTEGQEWFGFTEREVDSILSESGNDRPGVMEEIREWYDGYRFGSAEMYNPYSVMKYLKSGCSRGSYWDGSTSGGLSADLVSRLGAEPLAVLKAMREDLGFSVCAEMDQRIDHAELFSPNVKPNSVYSYLAMAGYLKASRLDEIGPGTRPMCRFGMVNREIAPAFDSLVERAERIGMYSGSAMDAVYARDPTRSKTSIEALLAGFKMDSTWKLEDSPVERHNRYRDLIAAYLLSPDMAMSTESPKGYGLTDIFYPGFRGKPPVIVEVKSTIDPHADLKSLAKEALDQIDDRRYADEPGTEGAVRVGIGVRMKTIEVAFQRRPLPPYIFIIP